MVVRIIYNTETLMDRLTRMIHSVFFSLTQRTVVTNDYGSVNTRLVMKEGKSEMLSDRLETQPRLPNVSTFSKRYTLQVMMLW